MTKKLYKLMNWPRIEGIIYTEDDNPHELLGAHEIAGGNLVQFFYPEAVKACVITKKEVFRMEQVDENGYFAAIIPHTGKLEYTIKVEVSDGRELEIRDPYSFSPIITQADTIKFNKGIHYTIYDYLGAHIRSVDGVEGVHFAVWAPNAMRVSVVGDFNEWDGRIHAMRRLWDSGIFELFIPHAKARDNYKFEIKVKGGLTYLKADPYAFQSQERPDNASVISERLDFKWSDQEWMEERKESHIQTSPMNVYELHLGSFDKPSDAEDKAFYNYRELAPKIISYVKKMGYTHIELMPIMEHPLDASWGYQVIGYYSPTSRYGSPKDFMYFMNEMHKNGIGVILDWVPAHFPRDTHGLSNFDGTCLYEHADPRKGSHPHWGTLIFNYGRPEVKNYLIANALYWITVFHADGIRIDAVASMLYLDYGKNPGEWVPNIYGGKENLEAIEFLKHLNSMIKKQDKGVLVIAEESTAWSGVTDKVEKDGLGFDMKWNMGWMNDFLNYISLDPIYRGAHHGELTFSMIYAYSEKFMLVLSHDEVVHGKASMISKMPGERKDKFANLRLSLGYMISHPGKKLLFMGQDIAEFNEWNENREVEWDLLQYDEHRMFNEFVRTLNHFYLQNPALYQKDHTIEGFEWINSISANENVIVFVRKAEDEKDDLLIVCNFANEKRTNYKIGVPKAGKYTEILNSDATAFGGGGYINKKVISSEEEECDDRENSIYFHMPPLSIQIFSYEPFNEEELKKIEEEKEERKRKAKELEKKRAAIEAEEIAVKIAREAKEAAERAEKYAKETEIRVAKEVEEARKKAAQEAMHAEKMAKAAKEATKKKEQILKEAEFKDEI